MLSWGDFLFTVLRYHKSVMENTFFPVFYLQVSRRAVWGSRDHFTTDENGALYSIFFDKSSKKIPIMQITNVPYRNVGNIANKNGKILSSQPHKPRPSACLTPIWLQTDTETQTLSVAPLKISFFRAATFFMRASGSLRVCGSVW